MKVYLATLGCKLNESELEAWTRQFASEGAEIVDDARDADLCVVNTCTVTQAAARKSRMLAKKVAHSNQNARVVVTGCYGTLSPEEAQSLPNVAFVVPNRDKDQLVTLASRYLGEAGYEMAGSGCRLPEAVSGELASDWQPKRGERLWDERSGTEPDLRSVENQPLPHPRTRAFVKIEDGCNMSCTYCIIPFARGRAVSRSQAEIVAEVARLVDHGYQEVILTGVQISDYRLEEREAGRGRLRGLSSLVREILNRTALPRLRLTSIAPWDLDPELLELFSDARLCRHLHLSLQSGSDTVLRRMRRPYNTEQFARAVELARRSVPDVGITTDVIVGFPGESDVEFQESLRFLEQMSFARVHVFPFSARDGTVAAQLPLQVSSQTKDARGAAMQRVAEESRRRFAIKYLGRALPVLYEAENRVQSSPANDGSEEMGIWSGYTDNYIHVVTQSRQNLTNRILSTRVEQVIEEGARGRILSPFDA